MTKSSARVVLVVPSVVPPPIGRQRRGHGWAEPDEEATDVMRGPEPDEPSTDVM